MTFITPKTLIKYVSDFDYNISLEQAKQILNILEDQLGVYNSVDIQRATDYIINGDRSTFAEYFE